MTLSQRIERIKQQLEATKPRSQRRTELQAQLRELRTQANQD